MSEHESVQNQGGQAQTLAADEPKSVKELPQWAQELIAETRQESANYRTRLRDAKEEARGEVQAQFQSTMDELKSSLQSKEDELNGFALNHEKLKIAIQAGVPGEQAEAFAARLQGSTVEELVKDAEAAKALFGNASTSNSRATDPSQGYGYAPKPKDPSDRFGEFVLRQLGGN